MLLAAICIIYQQFTFHNVFAFLEITHLQKSKYLLIRFVRIRSSRETRTILMEYTKHSDNTGKG